MCFLKNAMIFPQISFRFFASDAVKVVGIRSPLVPYLTAERYMELLMRGELGSLATRLKMK